jgi:acyl carrier protein
MEYAKEIRSYIVDNFLFEDDENLREDTSLIEDGIVDSTGILELVAFIEEQFELNVPDDELVPENFDSIRNLAHYVNRKRNGNGLE